MPEVKTSAVKHKVPTGPTDTERIERLEQALAELTRRTEGLAPRLGKYAALNAIFAARKEAVEKADAAEEPELPL